MNKLRQHISNDFMPFFFFFFFPNDDTHFVVIKCDVNRNVYSNRLRGKKKKKPTKNKRNVTKERGVAPYKKKKKTGFTLCARPHFLIYCIRYQLNDIALLVSQWAVKWFVIFILSVLCVLRVAIKKIGRICGTLHAVLFKLLFPVAFSFQLNKK